MIIYRGSGIYPAPLVTIDKTYNNVGGRNISATYNISLKGTLLPNLGSPNSAGTFADGSNSYADLAAESWVTDTEKHASLLEKQAALQKLFAGDTTVGPTDPELIWYPTGDSTNFYSCYPRLDSINFSDGVWVQKSDYEIRLTTDILKYQGVVLLEHLDEDLFNSYYLINASDEWSFEQTEVDNNAAVNGTHSLSATSKYVAGDTSLEPWVRARNWCYAQFNNSNSYITGTGSFTGINNNFVVPPFGADLQGYSRIRTESANRLEGSYNITERWTFHTANYIHKYTIRHNPIGTLESVTDIANGDSFTISGEIQGLASDASLGSRFTNAKTYFDSLTFTILKGLINSDYDLGGISQLQDPISFFHTTNKDSGLIQYEGTFLYFANETGIDANIVDYNISITSENGYYGDDNLAAAFAYRKFTTLAIIPIPGRANGPIIQDIGTRPERKRTINIDIKFVGWDSYADIDDIREAVYLLLVGQGYLAASSYPDGTDGIILTGFNDNLDLKRKTYSATITYVEQKEVV